MMKTIEDYISQCDECQRQNHLSKTPSELHPIPVNNKAFRMLGMDLVGPLRTTSNGNKYIIVLTDYLTKWPEVKAIPTKEASHICDFVIETICRHGTPETILTDNGREFCNSINDSLCKSLGITHRLTTPYHPQTNGLTERCNQTLCNALAKYVTETQDDWDLYRTCQQKSTKATPFFLTYGREAVLPVELDIPTTVNSKEIEDEDFQEMLNDRATSFATLLSTHEDTVSEIRKAQSIQKKYYDAKHAKQDLHIGDMVLVKNTRRINRKGDKIMSKWVGPYTIGECFGKGVYRLKERKKINRKSIKKYIKPTTQTIVVKPTTQTIVVPQQSKKRNPSTSSGKLPVKRKLKTLRFPPKMKDRQLTSESLRKTHQHLQPPSKQRNQPATKVTKKCENKDTSKHPKKSVTKLATTQISTSDFFSALEDHDKKVLFDNCMKMDIPKPRHQHSLSVYLSRDSPTLSFLRDMKHKHPTEMAELLELYTVWYMTSTADIQITEEDYSLQLAAAVLTYSYHERTDITTVLETMNFVPFRSLSTSQPAHIPKSSVYVGNVKLSPNDLQTLRPMAWLNDQVVHAFLGLLSKECNDRQPQTCYILPSFLALKWETQNYNSWLYPKVPLEKINKVLLPICHKHHWFLLSASMLTREVTILDSIPDESRARMFFDHWVNFMNARQSISGNSSPKSWTSGQGQSSVQDDGSSCGVFVLMNAQAVTSNVPPNLMRQCHVQPYRQYALQCLVSAAVTLETKKTRCDLPFCQTPDRFQKKQHTMVQCLSCEKWTHRLCLGLGEDELVRTCVFCG
ncbi:uncharacterized protein [Argopecten irradians]|uniref:uncharacterized protein n=1 Tax=Argopecten irradians TaxID=31199 RepID=UPI003723294D